MPAGPPKSSKQLKAESHKADIVNAQNLMAAQHVARKAHRNAQKRLLAAQIALQKIKAKNKMIEDSWKVVDTKAIDADACKPYPACLKAKAVCKDTYAELDCIRARRGSVNLCEKSASIQKTCCATCILENLALCKKVYNACAL